MIPRYTRPEMARIWSDENRFRTWLAVEVAATETLAAAGIVPKEAAKAIRARADFSVQSDTTLCLMELGGNDLLQGVDPKQIRTNLAAIVGKLKARRIPVLLAGIGAPPSIGAGYARDYNAVFSAVARAEHIPLYPALLAGVSGEAGLIQKDGVHPNAAGVKVIAARLAPVVAHALERRR